MSQLLVSKYYMDCISEDGHVFIGYDGNVKWLKLKFDYSNYLYFDASKQVFYADNSLKNPRLPLWTPPQLRWSNQVLNVNAQWMSLHNNVEQMLYDDGYSFIKWSCLQPLARGSVRFDNKNITGLGYTERLDMAINPLQLPFDSIRWGRFTAPDVSMTWIEWQGKHPLSFVYFNGIKYDNVSINEDFIKIHDLNFELKLTEHLELRKGSLMDTVFKNLQWLLQFFPIKMLTTFETKWRCKGILTDTNNSESITYGWAIHEKVSWT